ncbi:hypothetical protein N7510_003724 [Penicillium lagena]|uniref:uncharacterized protein n=1 Tax=Penicillium lagena TaxID=94218 RepID=UPI00254193D5|nr:uncharacterized protein N7510_003724 [Penicillium lagena]KAJ5619740.1 hypothetical protein N7510_003724 [Penicillium lagena]
MAVNYLYMVADVIAHDGVSQPRRFCEEATGFPGFRSELSIAKYDLSHVSARDDDPLQIGFTGILGFLISGTEGWAIPGAIRCDITTIHDSVEEVLLHFQHYVQSGASAPRKD